MISKRHEELVSMVIGTVFAKFPEVQGKLNFRESHMAPEPMYFLRGASDFYTRLSPPIERDILEAAPCVVVPDIDRWLSIVPKASLIYIKEHLGLRYLTRDIVVAFALYHECYHAMRFMEVDTATWARSWSILKIQCKLNCGDMDEEKFSRAQPEEREADEFASRMIKEHWDDLFPQYVPYVCFSGTHLSAEEINMWTHGRYWGTEEPAPELSEEEKLAQVRAERLERSKLRAQQRSPRRRIMGKVNKVMDFIGDARVVALMTIALGGFIIGCVTTVLVFLSLLN